MLCVGYGFYRYDHYYGFLRFIDGREAPSMGSEDIAAFARMLLHFKPTVYRALEQQYYWHIFWRLTGSSVRVGIYSTSPNSHWGRDIYIGVSKQ